jgi:hypothetical protein
MSAFKSPREGMTDIISEAHPEFDALASRAQVDAVERAQRTGGAVERDVNWERTATPEQREARRQESLRKEHKSDAELEKDLGGQVTAKYKIEVTFVKNRNLTGLNPVGVQIWESGKRFHGGGDELMYWCKDNRPDHNEGCWAPIPSDCIRGDVAICPKCNRAVNAELLTNMRLGNVYMDTLSKDLAKVFRSLNSNADIYLKFHKTDVRYIAMERAKGPDVARRLKGMAIYPLKNIIKDTESGSDLAKRLKSFVTA